MNAILMVARKLSFEKNTEILMIQLETEVHWTYHAFKGDMVKMGNHFLNFPSLYKENGYLSYLQQFLFLLFRKWIQAF